jgi:hypothetical protein
MTSKLQAIKKLKKSFPNYSIQIEAATSGQAGTQGAKVLIQILEKQSDKAPLVVQYSSAYGFAGTLKEAQELAVVEAVENLGL